MVWEQCNDVSVLTRFSVSSEGLSQYVIWFGSLAVNQLADLIMHRLLQSGRWRVRALDLLFPFKGVARVDNSFEPSDNAPCCIVSLDR